MFTHYLLTYLSNEVARGITEDGHYYFEGRKLLDAFGLTADHSERATAVDHILTFNKHLNYLHCDLMKVGFVRLTEAPRSPGNLKIVGVWHAFTYTVQSRVHQNQPLVVTEAFQMDFPIVALASMTASMWIQAYRRRPQEEIFNVAQGK